MSWSQSRCWGPGHGSKPSKLLPSTTTLGIVAVERVLKLLEGGCRIVGREHNVLPVEIGAARKLKVGDDKRILRGPEDRAGRIGDQGFAAKKHAGCTYAGNETGWRPVLEVS
jgi:hypothetical protein